MYHFVENLIKKCEMFCSAFELDIYLADSNFNELYRNTHYVLPDYMSNYLKNYYESSIKNWNTNSNYYVHRYDDLGIFFFDMKIISPQNEIFYVTMGPALYERCDIALIHSVLSKFSLPISSKNELEEFYKKIPYYTERCKNILWMQYHFLLSDLDVNEINNFLHTEFSSSTLGPDIFLFSQTPTLNHKFLQQNIKMQKLLEQAISSGDISYIQKFLSHFSLNDFAYFSAPSSLRMLKNDLIAINSLCNAAALNSNINYIKAHKLYIDHTIQIEDAVCPIDLENIFKNIFVSYCTLVNESHTQGHSVPIANALQHIHTFYDHPLTLSSVAKVINYSEGHLSRLFKKETGKTFGCYLNEFRIQHAISLLKLNSYATTDIALAVGFSSYTKFSIEFKKYTGKSAREYLKDL